MAANLTSGVLAAAFSHPFDTVKTSQQSAPPAARPGLMKTAKTLYAERGIPGFFAGIGWRGLRVVTAITTIGAVKDSVIQAFQEGPQ